MLLILLFIIFFILYCIFIIHREKIIRMFVYSLPKILYNKKCFKEVCLNMFNNEQIKLQHNFYKIPKHNTIFVVNYPITKLEYLVCNILPVPTCLVSSEQGNLLLNLVYDKDEFISFPSSKKRKNFNNIEKRIKKTIQNKNIYVYVENIDGKAGGEKIGHLRIGSGKNEVRNIRSGMFHIAKNNNLSITPLAVDYVHFNNNKIPNQNFNIRVGETKIFSENDDIDQYIQNIKKFFKESKKIFKIQKFIS
jgi:hypothetical protein